MRTLVTLVGVVGAAAVLTACSAKSNNNLFGGGGNGGGTGTGTGTSTGNGGSTGQGGDLGIDGGSTGNGGSGTNCTAGPDEDKDKDGFTITQGDCNDCDPNVNPNAVEVIATPDADGGTPAPADEDCDGKVDNVAPACDPALAIDSMDPFDGAKAVDLCKKSGGATEWGVTSAQWVMVDGSPAIGNANFHLGHGMLTAFGPNVNVQHGGRMLGLSSGTARQPTDPGYQDVGGFDKGYTSGSPVGFPKESPACPGVITGQPHDGTALELTIRAPSNAHGFSFDFNFFTYEWPGWICSQYNDFFVALLMPFPMGQSDGNISFDSQGNPVSVNNAFLEICGCAPQNPPCQAGGKSFTCALGDQGLVGTGFGADTAFQDHASTGWLVTKAPIDPNAEITIRWGVYDSGDGVLDTTTLVDNWQWIASAGTKVGTDVVPTPK